MRSWLEVSLCRIRGNYRAVRKHVDTGIDVMPVVKADAYGHGALEVAVSSKKKRALARYFERRGRRRAASRRYSRAAYS